MYDQFNFFDNIFLENHRRVFFKDGAIWSVIDIMGYAPSPHNWSWGSKYFISHLADGILSILNEQCMDEYRFKKVARWESRALKLFEISFRNKSDYDLFLLAVT
jgi:hypothetical protein